MFSKTENNSASDSVNTRPRLKAYLNLAGEFIKNNQQRVALIIGYLLVASLFYQLGQFTAGTQPPDIRIEEPSVDLSNINNTLNAGGLQIPAASGQVAGETTEDCAGKIKGNISSSSKIYHMPGGAFYNRTNPEMCFATEAEAQAAGFRRSQR